MRGCVSPPGPEPQVAVAVPSLPHAPPWASEHPVAVLQPQPQTPQPQPRAPLGPSLDKPWEAIKPVQPWLESAPYHHHQQLQQQQQQQPSPAGPAPPPPVRSIESKLATATLGRDGSAYHAFLEDEGSAMTMTMSHRAAPWSDLVYPRRRGPVSPGGRLPARPRVYPHPGPSPLPMSSPEMCVSPPSARAPTTTPSKPTGQPEPSTCPPPAPPPPPGLLTTTTTTTTTVVTVTATGRGPADLRTEVPPPQASSDEEMFYYQRSAHRCRGYAPPAAEPPDYHVTRLQPFFENGRVQYRYSPFTGSWRPGRRPATSWTVARLRLRHSLDSGRDREASRAYHYLLHQRHSPQPPHHAAGVREHGFVSRDMPPAHLHAPQGPGGACLPSWEAQEEAEHLRGHSLRRESRARQRLKGPVLSQYDNLGPYMPPDAPAGPPHTPATESLQHLRSKSDPGKEARYNVTPEAAVPRSLTADPDAFLYMETEKHAHAGPRPAGPRSHTPSSQPHGLQHVPEASRLSDADRAAHRGGRSPEGESLQRVTATVTPKPERSHSRGPWGPEPDPHPRPPQRHTPSGVPSHYDNLEEYRPPATTQTQTRPAPKDPLASRGGAALFPGQAFGHGRGGRAYSTALGQGAFIQTDAPLHRPEAEVKAE
ncbi:hypothetical protein AALO_G00031280 [Alosa alosa]|uniref:Uncharacterized protein n=1 Tax=Alosa alosa TaxID=278164 RepID=A0AAV6HG47_9TELE|nr:hypothetical protein AALO_G00031280 [Alosa alosa]